MITHKHNKRLPVLVGITVFLLLFSSVMYLTSCTDTLQGDVNANQKPIVNFVNIPPEGQRFSRNPVVYWYGTDTDGLIDYYRYHIATESDLNGMSPDEYIQTLSDEISVVCDTVIEGDTVIMCDTISDWIYIDVDPVASDPRTTITVPLVADTSSPVLTFVPQWVFVQAFDMEGLGSDIVYRLFTRNDNPPQTSLIVNPADTPFVNAPEAGGVITGVRVSWSATDKIDYPQDPPPFEFEWRLYGPYTDDELQEIKDLYVTRVFETTDGFVYRIGDTLIRCDTLIEDTIPVESCDTILVDPGQLSNGALGKWENYIRVNDDDFLSSEFNRVEDSSWNGVDTWVMSTSDTLYNIFKHVDSVLPSVDTAKTTQLNFFFWIRARDDAKVADLTPAFNMGVPVLNPKFERTIGIVDFTATGIWGAALSSNDVKSFWRDVITNWNENVVYIDSVQGIDYLKQPTISIPLKFVLSHKILILYNDAVQAGAFANTNGVKDPVFKGIDAGVNVWATWRAPIVGGLNFSPSNRLSIPSDYSFYFGVRGMVYSAWLCLGQDFTNTNRKCPYYRIEDFVGAYSLDSTNWPNINIRPDLIENRYTWGLSGFIPFIDSLPCLPEVDWSEASFGAEVLYLYKSIYGPNHPLGSDFEGFDFVMEGAPVGHRFNSGLFRTVHFNFTPLAIDTTTGSSSTGDGLSEVQSLVNHVLDWLYDPSLTAPVSRIRYPDAQLKLSVSEQRRKYWERNDRRAREEGLLPDLEEQIR